MRQRIGGFVLIVALVFGSMPVTAYAEVLVPKCSLCILEVQTSGGPGREDEDYVIIANVSASNITSSGIQLRYLNSLGVPDSTLGIGTFAAGQVKVYASDMLKSLNPGATRLPMALYGGGGTLQIARTSGSTTTVYDRIGWGDALLREGEPAGMLTGATLARKALDGTVQDTDNNSVDFEAVPYSCQGIEISEIQPFATDVNGQATPAWIELSAAAPDSGDCTLVTAAGSSYLIPAQTLPGEGELALIDQAADKDGNILPLYLGETSGQLWFASQSVYGGEAALLLPSATIAYSNLIKGQSWAFIDTIWRKTFQPTPGMPNVYVAEAAAEDDDPGGCSSLLITELLPNPLGDDTDREWIELHNQADQAVSLTGCGLNVGGTLYTFPEDDQLAAGEWRTFDALYGGSGALGGISLKNSGETTVALQRQKANGTQETLQAFVYADAPEGQSWARFEDGWKWLPRPTPNLDNVTTMPDTGSLAPTEFPAPGPPDDSNAGGEGGEAGYPTLAITELLPNPGPPQTDERDEFIEVYNPNPVPVSLRGYKLQAGNTYSYSHTFTDETVDAGQYFTLTSGASSLSLSNNGGRARLLDPSGKVVSETDAYTAAGSGQAWAFIGGKWQWTGSPTPGFLNSFTAIPLLSASKAPAKTSSKKTTAVKKVSTPKVSSAKTTKKTTKKKQSDVKAATSIKPASSPQNVSSAPPLHVGILVLVGVLAVGYALYEYRRDIAHRIYQFQRYRRDRREDG